jgi:predicted amidohydrolase YtcJ
MIDGVIESHTAAMLGPYADDSSLQGKPFWDPVKYQAAVAELDKRGLQILTHAIGDAGVRSVLDAYQNMETVNHTSGRRPRIEHIETISTEDIPRFGQLGVIASMQPLHAYPDQNTLTVWARNAGPDRASRAWVWNSIAQDGGRLAFGSDWPVVTLNPFEGIETAVTRQTADGLPKEGFVPSQRISVAEAIRGYTQGAAYAGFREKDEGSIEPGKLADMIILSQNLFEVEPSSINKTKVLTTIAGGRVVFEAQ